MVGVAMRETVDGYLERLIASGSLGVAELGVRVGDMSLTMLLGSAAGPMDRVAGRPRGGLPVAVRGGWQPVG